MVSPIHSLPGWNRDFDHNARRLQQRVVNQAMMD